jgi:hypothetical protein
VEKLEISPAGAEYFRGLQRERVAVIAQMFKLRRADQ